MVLSTSSGSKISSTPLQVNWTPVDETTTSPGEFGLYTYLLFKGETTNNSAVGLLEDFILTIETLPVQEIPEPDDDGETQTGFGFSVGRTPSEIDTAHAARDAAERATRLLGATKPASARLTVVLDPFVTAQFLGTFKEFPPRMKPGSFSLDRVLEELQEGQPK